MIAKANKNLGQHFLTNKSAIKKIVDSLDLQKNDTLLEIGPGRGALTFPILEKCKKLGFKFIAIEKDKTLTEEMSKNSGLEVVEGDVLKNLSEVISRFGLKNKNYKIVGNIPYYITGKLLRTLSELEEKPSLIVLTIQKEVAERIVVKPPRMNLLAAATQIWADTKILEKISKDGFSPAPKVDSSVIKLTPLDVRGDLKKYYFTAKIAFQQPRKTVLNNLSTGLKIPKNEALKMMENAGLEGSERPQNLSTEILLKLSTLLS